MLHDKKIAVVDGMGRAAKSAGQEFASLGATPIIETKKTAAVLGMAFNTVFSAVNRLVGAGIFVQSYETSRNRTFVYVEYLEILRGGTE